MREMNESSKQIQNISEIIRGVFLRYGVVIVKIILFGSRARNDNSSDSDYDFVAICSEMISHDIKMKIWLETSRLLSVSGVSADIIIKSESEYVSDRSDKGKVTYYADKEGVAV